MSQTGTDIPEYGLPAADKSIERWFDSRQRY